MRREGRQPRRRMRRRGGGALGECGERVAVRAGGGRLALGVPGSLTLARRHPLAALQRACRGLSRRTCRGVTPRRMAAEVCPPAMLPTATTPPIALVRIGPWVLRPPPTAPRVFERWSHICLLVTLVALLIRCRVVRLPSDGAYARDESARLGCVTTTGKTCEGMRVSECGEWGSMGARDLPREALGWST